MSELVDLIELVLAARVVAQNPRLLWGEPTIRVVTDGALFGRPIRATSTTWKHGNGWSLHRRTTHVLPSKWDKENPPLKVIKFSMVAGGSELPRLRTQFATVQGQDVLTMRLLLGTDPATNLGQETGIILVDYHHPGHILARFGSTEQAADSCSVLSQQTIEDCSPLFGTWLPPGMFATVRAKLGAS